MRARRACGPIACGRRRHLGARRPDRSGTRKFGSERSPADSGVDAIAWCDARAST
ncbi:Hypothetical protein A7982_02741 [Minicystis rosea]|nr:Hypothetical protein A7982_02741 [Minicystis rosea]